MRLLIPFFLLLINLGFALQKNGIDTPLNFRIFGSKEGFYSDRVKAIQQDSFGFLWIGTKEGLIKFDGHEFVNFNQENTTNKRLLTSVIEALLMDKKGNIWIGTNKGVIVFNQSEGLFHPIIFPNHKEDYYVVNLAQDKMGQIWAGTNHGVFSIDAEYRTKSFFANNQFGKTIPWVAIDKSNHLLVVSHNHIFQFNIEKQVLESSVQYSNELHLNDNVHTCTTIDTHGFLWIGKYNGDLTQYDPIKKTFQKFDFKIICKNPSAIADFIFSKDADRTWFAINESGIWYFDYHNNRFEEYITPNKTGQNITSYKIGTVYIDHDNNFWFGIGKTGLAMTNSHLNIFHNLLLGPTFKHTIVSAIYKDQQQHIWAGTDGGGILLYDTSFKLLKSFVHDERNPLSISNDVIMSIFEDSKKRVWIGTFRGGINQFHPENNTFTHFAHDPENSNGLLRNDIRRIAEDKEGNLWLVVHGKGLSCFNPEKQTFINYPDLTSVWTYDVLIDHEGTIWAATNNGVIKKPDTKNTFEDRNSNPDLARITDNDINCLFEDNKHTMWIGTVHGLFKYYKKGHEIKVESLPQFHGINIKSIKQNPQGFLFISSNEGIFQLAPDNSNQIQFNEGDGLPANDFVVNSSFMDSDGIMFFGSAKGLCWFEPSTIPKSVKYVNPIITDVKVFNKSILPSSPTAKLSQNIFFTPAISLDYNENHFIFEFAQPSYLRSEKAGFEYKMEGIDKEWQNTGANREAVYPGLPPGTYILQVRAKNNLINHTNDNPVTSLSIEIKPPLWGTWWFRTLFILIIIGSTYRYIRYKTKEVKIKNKELEDKVRERTSELQEKTNLLEEQRAELEIANASKSKLFSIIAHDLRSPFSAVVQWADLLNKQEGSFEKQREILSHIKNSSKNAYQVLENLLQWAKTQTNRIVFTPEWVELKEFTEGMVATYSFKAKEKDIHLEFILQNPFSAWVDRNMMETIVRNLLDNALKFTPDKGKILIELNRTTSGFDLRVKDNGRGMTPLQLKKLQISDDANIETSPVSHINSNGLGLYLCKEFMNYHKATWVISSEAEKGTEFLLHFPCEYQEYSESAYDIKNKEVAPTPATETAAVLFDAKDLSVLQQKTILVVEDQLEIRKLIVHYLEKYFTIKEAVNGAIAIEMVNELMPDLIISDIVMPQMNGIEFTTLLKNDILTSHIPVILLTSQKEESDIINGLQTGADDYILKPFNPEILIVKTAQLLLNRERLKKKFRLDDSPSLDAISENSIDNQLIKKVYKIIDENLSDEEFGVESLSAKIGMHRSTFSRKITAVTGVSPQELIKTQRLKHAAQLLLASGKNVSEIAYEVGFSDPKYFSRSFKAYFGHLPSEYSEINKIK